MGHVDQFVAGFRIGPEIGRGAMGVVHVAENETGQRVALKLLAPELAADERFRRRFLRESAVAATLDHPNVVATIAAGDENIAGLDITVHEPGRVRCVERVGDRASQPECVRQVEPPLAAQELAQV